MTGTILGMKSERKIGLVHGAAVGAFTGASFSLYAVSAAFSLWISFHDNEPPSFPLFIEVITSLLKPTLVYLGEEFGPVRNQNLNADDADDDDDQVAIVETNNQVPRFIDKKGGNALHRGSILDKLPVTRIADKNIYDSSENRISCSVSLEDFEVGEVAERLPICLHMFHRRCIAKWRVRHRSCPLCRTNQ
ncbi:NEP1-interacting protein 1 [Camellia lanceoleosa]|uniref:NEP1-interacting protein 1 n=1 Tax=Camellia lanceoleosa TaxID=1840588 RepID=A0ACC0GZH6_9ERIC|nr:NEP1-interacting protein 1 [Camellia lanceoleosa]